MMSTDVAAVRPAGHTDLETIVSLLSDSELPTVGVADWIDSFFVADQNGFLVGAAGLEIHGCDGLLRSLVVMDGMRNRRIGRRLAKRVIGAARAADLRDLYLLTTTAERYFARHGFLRVERPSVSPKIQKSIEFREACPATATAMVLHLSNGRR